MKPVITPQESARLDATATDPVEVLMDRAGLGVALAAVGLGVGYGSRVQVLAGPGNNGGDGYVAARYLSGRGAAVHVHALGHPRSDTSPSGRAAAAAVAAGIPVTDLDRPRRADLVIDALFGAGFRGELPDPVEPWLDGDAPVLAVDVPSGLDAATGEVSRAAFRAAATVTFQYPKVGHFIGEGPDRCGALTIVDIGLPTYPPPVTARGAGVGPELLWCEQDDAPRPARKRRAHKWSAGGVLVVGGSPGITGAPLLAATAALHFGAGAVAVACPGGLQPVYESMAPGVMTVGIGESDYFEAGDAAALLERAERYDVLALGPGLGPKREAFVAAVTAGWQGRLVVDADGLNALPAASTLATRSGETILTPHPGEFRRIAGAEPGYRPASAYAAETTATVVLKGAPTFIAGRDRWLVTSGGPELATIGTGDVLTGMIAALWGRGLSAADAARSGAFWHGIAARELARAGTVTAERLAHEVGRWAW